MFFVTRVRGAKQRNGCTLIEKFQFCLFRKLHGIIHNIFFYFCAKIKGYGNMDIAYRVIAWIG